MMAPRWLMAASHLRRVPEVWRCAHRVRDWRLVTQAYLQLGASKYPLEFRTRSGVHLRVRDFYELVTAWVIFCRDEYVVRQDAGVILDLGANYGAFTLLAAMAAPQSKIVSVEPFPETYDRLCENVTAHQLMGRVKCWPLAVAAEAGGRSMSTSPEIESHSKELLPATDLDNDQTVRVETITLADLLKRVQVELNVDCIDLVKMDIEGAEHEFLPEAAPDVLARVGAWQMEYHPRKPKGQLFAALERAGLKCIKDIELGLDYGVAHFERR